MEKFERVVERLLASEIICETAFPMEFAYLSGVYERSTVDEYLLRIGRRVATTSDGLGYLMVFNSLDSKEKQRAARAHFQLVESELSTLISWLRLARSVDVNSNPISAGERLNESELLAAIESSRPLAEQLTTIANKLGRAVKSREVKTKLASVLSYLVDSGYFVRRNSTGSIYEATAKWSFIYDTIEFYVQRQSQEGEVSSESEVTPRQQMELV